MRELQQIIFHVTIFSKDRVSEFMVTKTKVAKLLDILKAKKVINAAEASKLLGNKMAIYRLAEEGLVVKFEDAKNLGIFTLPDVGPEQATFAVLSQYYPDCVVSGITCLRILDLGLDYIDRIHVDIAYPKDLKNELFETHRVKKEKINHVIEKAFEDRNIPFPIKIYNPERAMHEAYKYYGKTDAFYRAIKKYSSKYLDRKSPGVQYQTIKEIDSKVGAIIVDLLALGDVHE